MHSCLCFSLFEKLLLKASLTPPRHLAICRASKLFLIAISTPPQHLVDRSRLSSSVFASFLDTSSTVASINVVFLDTFFDRWLDTFICRELLRIYIFFLCDPVLISSISLDLSAPVPLPNTISLTPNLFPSDFSNFFKFFFTW